MDAAMLDASFEETKVNNGSSILKDHPQHKVFRTDQKIIKFGVDKAQSEAKTLICLQKYSLNVKIPKVLTFSMADDGFYHIEMEEIQGRTLRDIWPELSDDEKEKFAKQLHDILNCMRSIQGTYIGGLGHTSAIDMRWDRIVGGPFTTESAFNEFLLADIRSRAPRVFRDIVASKLSGNHAIVLTHGDLTPGNIIVEAGNIVGLIDWEFSGFYPEYWEYVTFLRSSHTSTNWRDFSHIIFAQPYPDQYLVDNLLGQLSKH